MTVVRAPQRTVPVDAAEPPLSSGVLVLTGLSFLFVGWGFSYLDRRFNGFGLEGVLWLVWAVLGFGAGALNVRKADSAGQTQWAVLGGLGLLLAVFPGFVLFNLLRWSCLTLMIVIGARAAILRTRRDFYFTLTVIFVVSFMVGTHGNADWTLWFYLGPAWVFGGLALAWEHAAGTPLSRWIKLSMTLGFMGTSLVLAALLFFFMPRPDTLGFGFLPPGTDTPGRFTQAAGAGGTQPGGGERGSSGANGEGAGGAGGEMSESSAGGGGSQWREMLQGMRAALGDKFIPGWQRSAMETMLGAGEWLLDKLHGRASGASGAQATGQQAQPQPQPQSASWSVNWLLLLLLLVAAYYLWKRRYRIGVAAVVGCAGMLAPRYPVQSMRMSALALKWCLRITGHRRSPGQSVREHWAAAAHVTPLAKSWLGYAMESYCAVRFGGVPATPKLAQRMHTAVQGACDIVMGAIPELNR